MTQNKEQRTSPLPPIDPELETVKQEVHSNNLRIRALKPKRGKEKPPYRPNGTITGRKIG